MQPLRIKNVSVAKNVLKLSYFAAVPGESNTNVHYTHLGNEDRIFTARLSKGAAQEESLYIDGAGIDDHLFEISSDTGVKRYVTDHLGSVINSQAAGGKSVYGVFGENLGTVPSTTTLSEPVTYGFTGRELDVETGLYYYRARSYDPQSARFLTKDPIGPERGGDVHPYRYVMNDPVNRVDPMGTDSWLVWQMGHFAVGIDDPNNRGGVLLYQYEPASQNLSERLQGVFGAIPATAFVETYAPGESYSGFRVPFSTVERTHAGDVQQIQQLNQNVDAVNRGDIKYNLMRTSDGFHCLDFSAAGR
ncbi:MAG: RHS repeat-associated core domain-containing protein [Deltaproteobacteria bacterium]|jgi:RHS repeat-associated protein|nr:RHS repeat-associated core domain-containing protein [Deltaproteobacteria bacterium]